MEFNDEQQKYIDNLLEETKKGLYTKEDLDREVTREVDRRVESGIQKGIETHRSKWEEEFSKKASMTAEELANEKLNEQMKELEERENEILVRANTLDAKDKLAEAGLSKDHYEKFIGMLVTDDVETTHENVDNFINTFNETKSDLESNIKKQYADVLPPKGNTGKGSKSITKEQFDSMSYLDKLELKNKDEDLYNKLKE